MKKSFSALAVYSTLFIFTLFALPLFAHAEANAGFVDKSIWFSNEPDTAGETTNISTLINNQDAKAIYGVVGFYDNGKLIAQKPTTVEANASKVVTISWKVTSGSHSMVVKFEDTKYTSDKGTATGIAKSETSPYRFSVAAPAETTADSKTTGKTTTTDTKTGLSGSEASDTVEKAAGDVKDAAEGAFAKFDNFRSSTGKVLGEKAEAASKEVAALKDNSDAGEKAGPAPANADSGSFLQTPFAYLKMIFFKIAHFIFSSIYAFYGLIVLIIILFVRYLIRAPR
ncbi:MAG TPA: hypothetical protein PK950_02470 [Candidatus Paceibacterota bacterium]|nr:hypothetical protein [Candidatus Paceibacterota bacterium]